MSEAVLITLITAVAGILTVYLERVRRDVKAVKADSAQTRNHVVNSHGDTNMRHEFDARNAEAKERHEELRDLIQGQQRDIRGIRQDIGMLHGVDRDIRKALNDHLEVAEPLMPMLLDMQQKYAESKRNK